MADITVEHIVEKAIAEYHRQHAIWPTHDHPPGYWMLILIEEVGEAAQHFLQGRPMSAVTELIQCMAVLISWIECTMKECDDQTPSGVG